MNITPTLSFILLLVSQMSLFLNDSLAQTVTAKEPAKKIQIAWAGDGDTNILSKVVKLLSTSFQCEFSIGGRMAPLKDPSSIDEISRLSNERSPDTLFLLVLTDMPGSSFVEKAYKGYGVAVINIAASKPTKASAGSRSLEALHTERIQRESVRMVAQLLGVGICVFPRCAMSVARSEAELDEKSLNLCPPCAVKAEEALKQLGALRTPPKPPSLK